MFLIDNIKNEELQDIGCVLTERGNFDDSTDS
ncbi:hypothetical protein ROSI111154_00785 [Rouxiella silvae]|jgi:hypothetical protein